MFIKVNKIKVNSLNDIYVLKFNKEKYTLRICKDDNSFECFLLNYLKDYNLQIPKFVTSGKIGEKFYCVLKYIKGKNPTHVDNNLIISISKILKTLHSINVDFDYETNNTETYEKLCFYYNNIKDKDLVLKNKEYVTNVLNEVKNIDWNKFNLSILHSDIKLNNILVNENEVSLIDFGNAYIGTRLIDISRVLMWLCLKEGEFNKDLFKLFVGEYKKDNSQFNKFEKQEFLKVLKFCLIYNYCKDIYLFYENRVNKEYIEGVSLKWLDYVINFDRLFNDIGDLL